MNTDNFTYYNSETEAEAAVIPCRCCGQPMRTGAQQHWRTGDYYTLVTCDHTDCAMSGYTFSANGYADVDLSKYTKQTA